MEATPVKELITDNVIVSSNDEATLVKKSIKAGNCCIRSWYVRVFLKLINKAKKNYYWWRESVKKMPSVLGSRDAPHSVLVNKTNFVTVGD